jgi:hypothetical protein
MYTDKQVFVGRFSGRKLTSVVRVSSESVGEFEVDGSDFEVDYLTDLTAYSHRAAVVADGVLYWWGPKGVVQDNGINTPRAISDDLKPWINNLVHNQKTDEVHAVYNGNTKEIIWFYPPVSDETYLTHALVLNVKTGNFRNFKFKGKIDAAQNLRIENDDTPEALGGDRVIVIMREDEDATVQRPYFFDEKCASGDMYPTTEMMVKEISTPSTGVRRLTLATGYDATLFGTVTVGDYIAINQGLPYATTLTDADDMIAQIAAKGSGTIDITLPTGGALDSSATLAYNTYMPIWHRAAAGNGIHGFPWVARTRFYEPNGPNYFYLWLWVLLRMRVTAWPSPTNFFDLSMGYRTPMTAGGNGAFISDTIDVVDNTTGHATIYHALRVGEGNTQGTALQLDFSGIHIGNQWVIEYLEMQARLQQGNLLKIFEG